ncbi:MAG: DUF721 domain-containing protein [Muribaculaceae bacterium]|nr:DUF721 domain-containing protein [Muribaculaceae bacterium]
MKRTHPEPIGTIIDNFLKEEKLDTQVDEYRASSLWPQVVGPGVNRYTISRDVRQGVMYVKLSSSVLRQELMMGRSVLVKRINELLGRDVIHDIVFQ